jgi:hypothetical protein
VLDGTVNPAAGEPERNIDIGKADRSSHATNPPTPPRQTSVSVRCCKHGGRG